MSLALAQAPVDGGDLRYEYRGGTVRISGSGRTVEADLEWAFGAGSVGFTALGKLEGRYFEHRVSWLTLPRSPAVTPGQPERGVLGVFKTPAEAYACFNCHSTDLRRSADGGPDIESMTAGIQCERCHGPGLQHMDAARIARPAVEIRKAIFDAAHLPAQASIEVCGGCHRTRADLTNPETVRFQPVGLAASRCFRESRNFSCITCHDPHTDATRDNAAYYTAKCLNCHTQPASAVSECRRNERADCLPCHMRRTPLATGLAFTDHRIRIYR